MELAREQDGTAALTLSRASSLPTLATGEREFSLAMQGFRNDFHDAFLAPQQLSGDAESGQHNVMDPLHFEHCRLCDYV